MAYTKEQRLEYHRAWQKRNPDKLKGYYLKNKDKILKRQKAWYNINKEELNARRRADPKKKEEWQEYHARERDKINAKKKEYRDSHKAELAEYFRRYRKANPEKRSHLAKQRVYLKKSAGLGFTPEQWESLKSEFNYKCLSCQKFEPEIKLTADHVIPLTKSGLNCIENIQPLCHSCNSSKHTKTIDYRVGFEKVEK